MANCNQTLTQEKLDALRSEYKQRSAYVKYPRPKTKPEYQYIYPWLLPDEIDPHFVFCTVCECRLIAKRSDLGKHECSIKHTENALRKGIQPSSKTIKNEGENNGSTDAVVKWEYNEDYGDDHLLEYPQNIESVNGDSTAEDEENNDDPLFEPPAKRRSSESDSHSGLLDFLPLQVTINEGSSNSNQPQQQQQHTSSNNTQATTTTLNHSKPYQPAPCRITIKKVTAPLAHALQTHSHAQNEITSKATITPISGNYTLSKHSTQTQATSQQRQFNYGQISPYNAPSNGPAIRDSFDLFFESICWTVKALPPKLATEGKMRVMQLIGELEMRAISERERERSGGTVLNTNASPTQGSTAGQQNSIVASTTK